MSERLSPTQRMALAAVARNPGYLAFEYPGGMRTMRALAKRGLVRLDTQRNGVSPETRAYPSGKGVVWAEDYGRAS